jgi:hypothetical protein
LFSDDTYISLARLRGLAAFSGRPKFPTGGICKQLQEPASARHLRKLVSNADRYERFPAISAGTR